MEKTSEKLNNSLLNTTEKKQWVTPVVDIISNDMIEGGTPAPGREDASHAPS